MITPIVLLEVTCNACNRKHNAGPFLNKGDARIDLCVYRWADFGSIHICPECLQKAGYVHHNTLKQD